MKIYRHYHNLEHYLEPGKVLVIYGPRQVGKTTVLKDFLSKTKLRYRLDSGDNITLQHKLGSEQLESIKEYIEGYDLIAIDEAQKVPHIGSALKMMVDADSKLQVIATGSSSFALSQDIGEPLTGRKTTLTLFPVAQSELKHHYTPSELKENLERWLIFGCYPEVITAPSKEKRLRRIVELKDSYLLKDILELEHIKSSKKLVDLLRLLAFQIGSEVSLSELGKQLGIDYKTVARYLDLLEKSFVILNIRGFSRNLRKEMTKKSKYYFFDTGIRNALIANFNELSLRNDVGILWENFLFIERFKKCTYHQIIANHYFWRTWDQKEIDLIEEREGILFAYEFKWKNEKKSHPPKDWVSAYPDAHYQMISQDNYLPFIT